jgi:NTE family protein
MAKIKSTQTHLFSALVLSGGGARAAYQVGVLKAIADIMPEGTRNPFGIISGTSAGAINATGLAANADNFRNAVYAIEHVWKNFRPHQVYRTDPVGVFSCAGRWLASMVLAFRNRPVSLLDNSPLAALLGDMIRFNNLREVIDAGYLRALSITASGYSSGHSVAFFQGSPDISAWKRFQRIGLRVDLKLEHLLASAAIPVVFPAVRINREYFGDGAMRQLAPISPALHLGARKVLVVGVSGNRSAPQVRKPSEGYPSLAQISGHLLNSVFLDSLEYDIERLQRVNKTLELVPPSVREKAGSNLRPVGSLIISPTQSVDQIAAKYLHVLPATIRVFLHGIGATRSSGSSILSYLLFDRRFCSELIALGYHDAMAKADEIARFMDED